MALSDLDPAERHRRIAATFTDRVRATKAWDAPAPVAGWTARDVVRHLVEWFPGFLAGGAGVQLPAGPAVDDDPATRGRVLSNPHIGDAPLDQAIDRFYTSDVFMHTWDLARATGQDERLDPQTCADLLAGMAPIEELLRSSGQFGPRVPVPDDADVQTRLLGFIGRDPLRGRA